MTFYIFLHDNALEETAKNSKEGLFSFLSGLLKSRSSLGPFEFEVTLKFFDTGKGKYGSSSLIINLKEHEVELDIVKLAVGEMSDILERKEQSVAIEKLDIFYAVNNDIKEAIIKLSIANQVLTRRTAFICIAEEANPDAIQTLPKQKVIIPQLISSDYFQHLESIDMNYKPRDLLPNHGRSNKSL